MTSYTTFHRVTIAFILGLVSLPGFCQLSMGLEGGYTYNQVLTNTDLDFTRYRPAAGFSLGIPIVYKTGTSFAIVTGPSLVQKNYRFERTGYYTGNYANITNTYLQLPLMGRFIAGFNKFSAFANAGIFVAYWAASHLKGAKTDNDSPLVSSINGGTEADYFKSVPFDQAYSFDTRQDNRFEAGWIGGIGFGYQLTNRFQVVAEGRYLYSFTSPKKAYAHDSVLDYNDSVTLTLGLLVKLAH